MLGDPIERYYRKFVYFIINKNRNIHTLEPLNSHCGCTVTDATGYAAFASKPRPPDPPPAFDGKMIKLFSEADFALGALSGVASL